MHLKRTIKGTHIWVSAKHLSKYTRVRQNLFTTAEIVSI